MGSWRGGRLALVRLHGHGRLVAGDEVMNQETSGTRTGHLCMCHNETDTTNCVDFWSWSRGGCGTTVSSARCLFKQRVEFCSSSKQDLKFLTEDHDEAWPRKKINRLRSARNKISKKKLARNKDRSSLHVSRTMKS